MMAQPIKTLELHYPMIQFLIMLIISIFYNFQLIWSCLRSYLLFYSNLPSTLQVVIFTFHLHNPQSEQINVDKLGLNYTLQGLNEAEGLRLHVGKVLNLSFIIYALGVEKGTSKILALANFSSDLKISTVFAKSLHVSFIF